MAQRIITVYPIEQDRRESGAAQLISQAALDALLRYVVAMEVGVATNEPLPPSPEDMLRVGKRDNNTSLRLCYTPHLAKQQASRVGMVMLDQPAVEDDIEGPVGERQLKSIACNPMQLKVGIALMHGVSRVEKVNKRRQVDVHCGAEVSERAEVQTIAPASASYL